MNKKEFIWTDELVAEYSLSSQSLTLWEFKRQKTNVVLFTTEDGVEIKEDYAGKISVLCHDWSYNLDWDKDDVKDAKYTNKVFSTKEALKDYIIMNKPLFSVNEVIAYLGGTFYRDEFIRRAKEKINK